MKKVILLKKTRIKCPECSNYINAVSQPNGTITGKCPVCKSVVSCKQCSSKEKRIRIIKDLEM